MNQLFSSVMATIATLALACLIAVPGVPAPPTAQDSKSGSPQPSATPLSDQEIRALGERIISALHKNDAMLEEYERTEHHIVMTGSDRRVTDDKVSRVVPTGTGTMRLLVKDGDKPVDAETYRKELSDWAQVLEIANNPKDPRQQAAYAKSQKKSKDRHDLIEAARQAFHATWGGRENRDGRVVDILVLEPVPGFQPRTLAENVLPHVRAKIWVDDASGNILRGEAEITHDVYFGAGLLGKLYRGSRISADNTEVAKGFWAPTHVQYDFEGRKFLFMFETHEVTLSSRYHRVGPPSQALAIAKNELAHGIVYDP